MMILIYYMDNRPSKLTKPYKNSKVLRDKVLSAPCCDVVCSEIYIKTVLNKNYCSTYAYTKDFIPQANYVTKAIKVNKSPPFVGADSSRLRYKLRGDST